MVEVSIIIPVYNAEKYLLRCLDSVAGQTLRKIEIICVDDGSTDKSLKILEEYALHEPRMKVIHKENGGTLSARRTGEKQALGEYIGYVDSDDWIEQEMYEKLYTYAQKYKADMVTSGYFFEGNYTSEIYDAVDAGLYKDEGMEYLRNNTLYCLEKKEKGIRGSLCCKLISRKLVSHIQCLIPDRVSIGEDEMCVLTYVLESSSVLVLKETYYHYVINRDSKMHTENSNYLLEVQEVYQYLKKLTQHPNFTKGMCMQAELYIIELLIKGINTLMGFQTKNLLWFDPYWLEKLPSGSRIMLYGAGEAGRKCRKQILSKKDLFYVGCVDFEWQEVQDDTLKVKSPSELNAMSYDYIVITIKNEVKALQIRKQLEMEGIKEDKILWFEQRELFWKYVQAEGFLKM